MFDSNDILRLYSSVLHEDIIRNKILERDIRMGVRDMAQTYAKESTNFGADKTVRKFTDYNIPAFRCAYLHKYAPLHTYIVLDIMTKILNQELRLFKNMINSKQFRLCCLGGGPGSDAVGVLAALHSVFNSFNISVTVVDCMEQWRYTFGLVISHLHYAGFSIQLNSLQWEYIGADLLKFQNTSAAVNDAINAASLVTMVKFISAATCTDTEPMVEKIFRMMRPGALVLFIDNAAGGFTQIIERAGKKSNFKIIAGPYRHMEYSNEDLKVERFGYTSCFQTRVTIILMQKPGVYQSKVQSPTHSTISNQSVPSKKVPLRDVQNINVLPSIVYVAAQEKINKPLLVDETRRPSSQSIPGSISSSKRKAPLQPAVHNTRKVTPQATEEHMSLRRPNSSRPSSTRSITNENRIRPCSNSRTPKLNNVNRQPIRSYPQPKGNSSSPSSDRSNRPFIPPERSSYPEREDNLDTCCSCCAIS